MLILQQDGHFVVIEDEAPSAYPNTASLRIQDYPLHYKLGSEHVNATSAIKLMYGTPTPLHTCLILADGGITSVYERSGFLHGNRCITAVGPYMACLQLPDLKVMWHTEVDDATCFGVYHALKHESYISHGELEITRVSYTGEIVWRTGGKDIFTNGFTLYDDTIEVRDFNNEHYRIDILIGHPELLDH